MKIVAFDCITIIYLQLIIYRLLLYVLTGLTEDMAWPARPQDTYGLEKLYAEEMCLAYAKDFPIKTRMARYHNVYGPRGTWKGKYNPKSYCFEFFYSVIYRCCITLIELSYYIIVFVIMTIHVCIYILCRWAREGTRSFLSQGCGVHEGVRGVGGRQADPLLHVHRRLRRG